MQLKNYFYNPCLLQARFLEAHNGFYNMRVLEAPPQTASFSITNFLKCINLFAVQILVRLSSVKAGFVFITWRKR